MFGQSLLSAFGIACTTDTDQLFATNQSTTSTATYQLNNATTSIPSNTYPGTASNITYAAGKFGNAAVFNGSSSVIDISSSAINPASPYTISMWFNASNAASYEGLYTGISSSPVVGELTILKANATTIQTFSVATNGSNILDANTITVPTLSNNTWYNIVVIADRNLTYKSRVFINGVEGTNYTVGSSSTNLLSTIKIGYADNNYFDGLIDQVRFFASSLPQAAITALYNETTTTATSASVDYQLANPNSVAYYKMSDATDQLGNYNGTATNVNFSTEGKFGFAGSFNGSSSKIEIIPSPQDNSGIMSVSFWAKTSSTSRTAFFIAEAPDPNKEFLKLENFGYNGTNSFRVTYNNSFSANINNAAISDNNWHHIVVTAGNGNLKTYKDNVLLATHSITITDQTLDAFAIGFRKYNNDLYFDGEIDQVRIYDAVLSAADVSTLYKEVECEPAAINALANFNTVLYTGTGSSQSITNVGFAPDFVWIKDRDAANWHNLQDTIRGATKHVYSNATNAEDTTSDGLTSFDSDGFTIGGGGGFGNNGNNFVAWNWKAPLANLSTGFNGSSSKVALSGSTTLTNRTISMWINPSKSTNLTLLDNTQGKVNGVKQFGRWNMLFNYGGTNYAVWNEYNGSQYGRATFSYTFQVGTWYHIAFCVESGNNAVYVNGVSQTLSVTRGTSIGTVNLADCTLGFDRDVSSLRFEGAIDQVRIYSSALSASEVSDLYAEPAASNNTLNYPAGAGCIAAYPLQTNAVDLSGNYSGASSNVTFGQPGYLTSNTDGTITSTVAANVEAGFNIISYAGNGIAGATVGHGLGQQVKLAFFKNRTTGSTYWYVYSDELSGSTYNLYLNTADTETADNVLRGGNATTIEISNSTAVNATNNNYICYAWASIPGYSKIGSYVGNGSSNPIYVGFQPKFVMAKQTTGSGGSWLIMDSDRGANKQLYPNLSSAEYSDTGNSFSSTGFTMKSNGNWNNSGQTYIYLAIA